MVWNILDHSEKLWVELIQDKYMEGKHILEVVAKKGSHTWTYITKAWEALKDGFGMKLGCGEANFWTSPWVSNRPLYKDLFSIDIHDMQLTLRDVWSATGWDFQRLWTDLPQELKQRVISTSLCLVEGMPDVWVWKHRITGEYTAREGYRWLINKNSADAGVEAWNWIWKLRLPANIQFFVWQLCHAAIPTRGVLKRRGIDPSDSCPVCLVEEESITHCLFHCSRAKDLWTKCGLGRLVSPILDGAVKTWLAEQDESVIIYASVVMWTLWVARNQKKFEDVDTQITSMVVQVSVSIVTILQAFGGSQRQGRQAREVVWSKPRLGGFALHVDGSAITNPGQAGFGGLVRNSDGDWMQGFYGSVGLSNIIHAEIMAISHGLKLCWEAGIRNLCCFSDSLTAVKCIQEGVSSYHLYANEISLIRQWFDKDWELHIQHTLRRETSVPIT